jgi:hypothetical protein
MKNKLNFWLEHEFEIMGVLMASSESWNKLFLKLVNSLSFFRSTSLVIIWFCSSSISSSSSSSRSSSSLTSVSWK